MKLISNGQFLSILIAITTFLPQSKLSAKSSPRVSVRDKIGCVSSQWAHLRKSPSKSGKILWEVKKNMPLKVISSAKGWYQVLDVDDDISWIPAKKISFQKKCAIIRARKLPIYHRVEGKMVERAKLKKAQQLGRHYAREYESFPLEAIEGNWVKLKDVHGQQVWLEKKHLWITPTSPSTH